MAPSENFRIGTSSTTTNVESLTVPLPPPRSTYTDYTQPIPLASGGVRGGGWAAATWTWDFLTHAQRTQLKPFCSGKSATVYIRTRDNSGEYVYKTGVIVWPDGPEERTSTHVLNFTIQFTGLESFTP